jgi:hypothetical protein
MPHVILKTEITPEDIALAFEPLEVPEGGCVYKAQDCYLSQDKESLLVRSLVVERGFARGFFAKISSRPDGTLSVALESVGVPERTDAVKRLLGLYAWKIMQSEPQSTVESTNIAAMIKGPGEESATT